MINKSYTWIILYMSCHGKTASLSRELRELVSLRTSRESSATGRVTVLKSNIGARSSNTTLVSHGKVSANQKLSCHQAREGLSQSETFPPLSLVCSNVITPKPYKKRCACTSGSSLEVSQLVYTLGLSQSVALRLTAP